MLTGLIVILIIAVAVAGIRLFVRRGHPGDRMANGGDGAHIESATHPVVECAAEAMTCGAATDVPARATAPGVVALTGADIITRLHELAFGVPGLKDRGVARRDAVAAQVGAVLESAATQPRYAQRRPLLLPQLLRAMHDSEVSRRELASLIARDPALAGGLLKLANSPVYRINDRPVESIDRAVALLGTDGIRSLAAAAIVQPVFRVAGSRFPRFAQVTWSHTFRSAAAAEVHAALFEDEDPFAAQLLGLVMGLGKIVVFRVALDQYAARPALPPDAGAIAWLLDQHTAGVARRIAASWELSGRMLSALEDQMPDRGMHEPTALGRSLRFGRLIGALALLRAEGRVDDDTARASMRAEGATDAQFERVWMRLIRRREAT